MKGRKRNPLWFLVLAVALVAGIYLVQRNANTQRKAYFSGAKLLLQPSVINTSVDEEIPVQLWIQTDMVSGGTELAKVSSVDTIFCYGKQLRLNTSDLLAAITLNGEAFKSVEYISNQNNCLRLVVVSSGIAPEDLKSGMVQVASIKFKAVSVGSGNLTIDANKSTVAGYNPVAGATDMTIKIGSVQNATYAVGGTSALVSRESWGEKIIIFIKNLFGR